MAKKNKPKFKYKLILLNESTLEEVFRIKASKTTFTLALGLFSIISFALLSVIIFTTPLKHMLPGYADTSIRENVIAEAKRIDSLEIISQSYDKQLLLIKNIIAGNITLDSASCIDSTDISKWNQLPLIASPTEDAFVKQYEEENAFNVDYNNYTAVKNDLLVLVTPAFGTITQHVDLKNNKYNITISCSSQTPILSPKDGLIISAEYHPTKGYTLIIQHSNGYLSIFRHLGEILCSVEDKVNAGTAIALTKQTDDQEQNSLFEYELWHNGIVLNPEDYMTF